MNGIWNISPADKFDYPKLLKFREFFEQDLKYAQDYLAKTQSLADRFELPGEDQMLAIARADVNDSEANVAIVNNLITLAETKIEK